MTVVGDSQGTTNDAPAQALEELREHGMCLIPEVLRGDRLKRVREALYSAAEADRRDARITRGFALDTDDRNQRVWNLLGRDPVFAELAEHPLAMALVQDTLGWPALLSNISGNITAPGSAAGVLHADQVFVPEPWPPRPQGINVTWCIDDFTADNGATQVVPGSHRWNRSPTDADSRIEPVTLEAPAGSVFAFDSRIWHRTGANTSGQRTRAAIFPFYTTPVYRTQENWFLALDRPMMEQASQTLQTLLAWRSEGFGLHNGRSPHQA